MFSTFTFVIHVYSLKHIHLLLINYRIIKQL
jgi:hypothetical protein